MTAPHPLAPLIATPQWIVVLLVPLPNGKTDKVPSDYRNGGRYVDAHDPQHWTDHATALRCAQAWGAQYTVGFVITAADPFWCLDIDGALQADGQWSPLAHTLCQSLPNTAVEVSQSGRGLHIWGQGAVPPHSAKRTDLHIELYSQRRFIAIGRDAAGDMSVTCPAIAAVAAAYFPPRGGPALDAEPPAEGPREDWRGPADDADLIRRALASRSAASVFGGNRATFADLWTANAEALGRAYPPDASSSEPYDRSSADAALASHLAFWTGKDAARIARLMRQSALAREIWDQRDDYLVARTIGGACRMQRDVLKDREAEPAPTPPAPAGAPMQTTVTVDGAEGYSPIFMAAHSGTIDAKLSNVVDALASEESSIRIGLDTFQDVLMWAKADGQWRPVTDADYGRLRAEFERRGFKAVPAEVMRTAVLVVAEAHKFDSAQQWLKTLQWDGVPRIDRAMSTYYGAADTPYTQAVGAYVFTALAGRVAVPGVQADMVPVLVGLQGAQKTTSCSVLAPTIETFAEIDLHKLGRKDEDLSRRFRGTLVGELAELRGLAGRDQESIKAFLSRRIERWVPKFREFETTYPRRAILIGTTNGDEFLDDATGERRWLPVRVGAVNVEELARDRDQLWAEGAHRFDQNGVEWRAAEGLARDEHAGFKVLDPWHERIEAWLGACPSLNFGEKPSPLKRGAVPFTVGQVLSGALGLIARDQSVPVGHRAGKVLRAMGYVKQQCWVDGQNVKAWCKPSSPT